MLLAIHRSYCSEMHAYNTPSQSWTEAARPDGAEDGGGAAVAEDKGGDGQSCELHRRRRWLARPEEEAATSGGIAWTATLGEGREE